MAMLRITILWFIVFLFTLRYWILHLSTYVVGQRELFGHLHKYLLWVALLLYMVSESTPSVFCSFWLCSIVSCSCHLPISRSRRYFLASFESDFLFSDFLFFLAGCFSLSVQRPLDISTSAELQWINTPPIFEYLQYTKLFTIWRVHWWRYVQIININQ